MTPVFCCGFECGVSASHWSLDANTSFNTTIKRSGARSLRSNPTASTGDAFVSLTSASIHVFRVYIRFESLPSATIELMVGTGSVGSRPGAYFNSSDSKIYAGKGAASLGATGVSVTTGQWYLVDIKIIGTSNPTLIDVSVDGVSCGQASWASVYPATTYLVGNPINSNSTHDIYFDDIVISRTEADYPIGAGKVEHFVPTSDGTHNVAGANDFEVGTGGVDITNATTTAYQLVDDIPLQSGAPGTTDFINMVAPPNATDYVECVFGPAPGISTPTTAPRAVEVIAGIAQAGTGLGNMEIRLNDNGTTDPVYSATGVAGVTTIAYKRKHYAAGPAGAWVIGGGGNGDFTDLRVRFGSPAALDVNPDQYFTGAMIEAEFQQIESIPNKIVQVKQAVNRASTY